MQRFEVSGAVQRIYGSLGVKRLRFPSVLDTSAPKKDGILKLLYKFHSCDIFLITHRSM